MNTRFHVRDRVFGNRLRGAGADPEPGSESTASHAPADLSGSDPVLIDPMVGDSAGKSSSYLIESETTVLIDPGSAKAAPHIIEGLKGRRSKVDLILLTHVHPDAAAGAGVIARHFPEAAVAAPAGATGLLADPAAMLADMKKVYGDRAEKLYGLPTPIDGDRIRGLADGETINLGDRAIETLSTPGHTADHISFLDPTTASVFCGDALGVQLPGSRVVRPSTPPWDFSLRDSLNSIERLSAVGAETVYLAHFGAARPGPHEIFDRAADALERWHRSFLLKREQTDSDEDLSRQFNACVEASLEPIAPSVRRDLETVSPAWLNLAGLNAEQARIEGRLSDAA